MKVPAILAGLSLLFGALLAATAPAENPPPKLPADSMLHSALTSTQVFMFTEQLTSKVVSSADLIISGTRNIENQPESIHLRPSTVRIFRADAGINDFTKQGGLTWKCGAESGKLQFKTPGNVIMVVRDGDGTVHWYALQYDLRC